MLMFWPHIFKHELQLEHLLSHFTYQVILMVKKKTQTGSGKTIAKLKEKAAKKQEPARQPMIQAMVWYKEEHYAQLLTLFDDAELLPPTYQHWFDRAETKKNEVEARGDQVIKVFIDPETFPEWCEKRNLPKDANSRTQLAIEVAQAGSFSL
jgi:hypothetical protein